MYVYTDNEMGTKTISIMDDVYRLLVSHKFDGESFSDELRRILSKKNDIMQYAGAWNGIVSDSEAEKMKEGIARLRKNSTKDLLKKTRK